MTTCNTTKYLGAPGTSKTTRLLHEIRQLIEQKDYHRNDFVVTTFRRRMADELRNKLGWDLRKNEGKVNTIHGICRGLANINQVAEEKDKLEFCKFVEMDYAKQKNKSQYDQEPSNLSSTTNGAKLGNIFFDARSYLVNNLLNFSQIYHYPGIELLNAAVPDPESFMEHYSSKYQQWKEDNSIYDFDDMLQTVYQNKLIPEAKIMVVDEFQDLTSLQYAIICMWSKNMERILIAGDPRQTIYGFWGANARFFEEFEGNLITLSVSYRLPTCVWEYARKILKKADLKAPDIETTGKPCILKNITDTAYHELIPRFRKNTLHLVRTNEMGHSIAHSLAAAGIPFIGIYGWGTRQIWLYNAILKIRSNLCGNTNTLTSDELEALISAYTTDYFAPKKKEMREQLKKTKDHSFRDIQTWAFMGIHGHLWQEIAGAGVLDNCGGGLQDHDNLGRIKILTALEKHGELINTPSVIVSTIHGAKGGEADNVFLHNSITKKMYNMLYSDMDTQTIEQEAQVFYVGATRTKQALFIVQTDSKHAYTLPDIPEEG